MNHAPGDVIVQFHSADGSEMRVGDPAWVIDRETLEIHEGVLLYRPGIGAYVLVEGAQWHERTAIYATAEAARTAKRSLQET